MIEIFILAIVLFLAFPGAKMVEKQIQREIDEKWKDKKK